MSTKVPYERRAAHRAIILQALFASVGKPFPSVGQVMSYANRWGKRSCSNYEVQRELEQLKSEGLVGMEFINRGKMKVRVYYITQAGALALIAAVDHLPPVVRRGMRDLFKRASDAASAVLSEGITFVDGDHN